MNASERLSRRRLALLLAVVAQLVPAVLSAQRPSPATDARVGLHGGWLDAASAASNMELVASVSRPHGFYNATSLGDILFINSDLAFRGNDLFLGNFHGFQIYDISNPLEPRLRTALECPGGQGDMSVHGNLLFMSVEMPNGRVDCSAGEMSMAAHPNNFRGVRIFDISNLEKPKQVAAVQTCRGSHTHTLVPDPRDASVVYVYVSGTSGVRPAEELAGCSGLPPERDPNTSYFRIEVIRVPLASPQDARIVNAPRIFADSAGNVAGLWSGGSHGAGTQNTARTDQCHDITVYPAIGLAAGACSGNGILLDISDPAAPKRIAEVMDPNFAYWHSATFNNDGSKVLFTDEWGGGMAARCQATDPREWGADAIFELKGRKLEPAGYYKLPVPQSAAENCVAHNGSLVPVPGRDLMVQAWYQGGASLFDFTDPAHPVEIAYFDRGPLAGELLLGGYFSTYWYNGHIYGSEMGRGLDVLRLTANEQLTQNEIDAANLVRYETFNPQTQPRVTWPASFVVALAYVDQLKRSPRLPAAQLRDIAAELEQAEQQQGATRKNTLTQLVASVARLQQDAVAEGADARRLTSLAETLRELATTD